MVKSHYKAAAVMNGLPFVDFSGWKRSRGCIPFIKTPIKQQKLSKRRSDEKKNEKEAHQWWKERILFLYWILLKKKDHYDK